MQVTIAEDEKLIKFTDLDALTDPMRVQAAEAAGIPNARAIAEALADVEGLREWTYVKSASFDTITITRQPGSRDVVIEVSSREEGELPLVLTPPLEEAGSCVTSLFEMAEHYGY